jgi:CAAX prenyl protease-like protein
MSANAIPFIGPFVAFIVLMGMRSYWPFDPALEYPARVVIVTALVCLFFPKISWRPAHPLSSVGIGIAVFLIWIAPDALLPEWRSHWLFDNSITGRAESSLDPLLRSNTLFLLFRILGTAVLVPVIEELFWRGWMMRYIIDSSFESVPLGKYSPLAFWVTAALFASEHGPFWEVGLLAGIIYGWWMTRTRNLADCMLAHAVTNTCLAAYVLAWDQWQFWL